MIPKMWYIVLAGREVPKHKPLGAMRLGKKLVFWRDSQGKVTCQEDRCCHRGVQLSIGQVIGDCIECPFHGFQFQADGACSLIPSNGKAAKVPKSFRVKTYPVEEAHGWIWMYNGLPEEGETVPPLPDYFETVDDSFAQSDLQDEWPVHYTRSIENQIDVTHLAFTHKKTIGRGNQTVTDGPWVEWKNENTLFLIPNNRKDDGQSVALKPHEVEKPDTNFFLEFRFPNFWLNYIHPKMQLVAAFVPVDDTRTITYIRTYQKFVTIPGLRGFVNWTMGLLNRKILNEDREMVITQDPIYSILKMDDELLVPGDRAIIEYRRRRDELLRDREVDPAALAASIAASAA